MEKDLLRKIKKFCDMDVNFTDCKGNVLLTFVYDDVIIHNPFLDETYSKEVDPVTYYGDNFLNSDFCKDGAIESIFKNAHVYDISVEFIDGYCCKCRELFDMPTFSMNYVYTDGTSDYEAESQTFDSLCDLIEKAILDDSIESFYFGEYCPHCGNYLQ